MTSINIPVGIKLLDSVQDIQKMVMVAMRDEINQRLDKVAQLAQDKIQSNLKRIFIVSDEYLALINGPLDAHFGIPQGEAIGRLDQIIDTMAKSVEVISRRLSVTGNTFRGGLTVQAIPGDFKDLLDLQEGVVKTDKGQVLPWLEWLLLHGDTIIISDYDIEFGNYPTSRSGAAVMFKSTTKGWKVPIGVSGTINNNWITRAVNNSAIFLQDLISKAIEDSFIKVF